MFDDGIELNWIPPREPNGDIQHYIIKYTTRNKTHQVNTTNNINYYNLTGLERGPTYNNITVVAVNSAGGGGGSQPIICHEHNSTVECTSELELKIYIGESDIQRLPTVYKPKYRQLLKGTLNIYHDLGEWVEYELYTKIRKRKVLCLKTWLLEKTGCEDERTRGGLVVRAKFEL